MHIAKQVNVMRIRNVMNDKVARLKSFLVAMRWVGDGLIVHVVGIAVGVVGIAVGTFDIAVGVVGIAVGMVDIAVGGVGIAVGMVGIMRLFMRCMTFFRIVIFMECVLPFGVPIRLGMHTAHWRAEHHGKQ